MEDDGCRRPFLRAVDETSGDSWFVSGAYVVLRRSDYLRSSTVLTTLIYSMSLTIEIIH